MKIYTDGSCLKNPNGPSGWAFCLLDSNNEWYGSGGEKSSTNNRMEMTAVIEALDFISNNSNFNINETYEIYSDSKLVLNCAQNIWKRKCNLDLWIKFDKVSKNINIQWTWIKAHNGNKYNEIVDKISRYEAIKHLK